MYSKHIGDMLFCHAIGKQTMNSSYFFFIELGHGMIASKNMIVSSLHCSVVVVVCLSALKQMFWIATRRIVAGMQNTQVIIWPPVMREIKGKTMSPHASFIVNSVAISTGILPIWPFQTISTLYQYGKELFSRFLDMMTIFGVLSQSSCFVLLIFTCLADRALPIFTVFCCSEMIERLGNTAFCTEAAEHVTSPVDVPGIVVGAATWPGTRSSGATLAAHGV